MAVFVSGVVDSATTNQTSPSTPAGVPAVVPGSAGSMAGAPQAPLSMAESVTRHAQNPPPRRFQCLLCGIDTLDLGLYVSWDVRWPLVKAALDRSKEEAQGTTGLLEKSDIGRPFLHLPSGKPPNFRYHLQFNEYHLYVAIFDKVGSSPNVYVSILSETLWHVGISTILELLEFDLMHLGGTIERIQLSRVDLCADFRLVAPLSLRFIERHRVSRSRKTRIVMNGSELETFYCGSPSAPVQVRLYDKGKEITKSNKQWFLNLWGLDDPAGVWRVEFQLRRAFLHQYRVNTLDDLWQNIGTVWKYLCTEWFSLRLLDNEKTERRTVHPWWLAVQGCRERFGDLAFAKRTYTSDTMEPIQRTLAHIIGRTITIAAHNGIKDRQEAINHLCRLLDKRLDDKRFAEEYERKCIKLGYRGTLGGSDDEC